MTDSHPPDPPAELPPELHAELHPQLLRELLLASSRTFALGIERLREPLRSEVRLAYLLLRVSDYLEDSPLVEPGEKAELLDLWDAVLAGEARVEDLADRLHTEDEVDLPDARVAGEVVAVHSAISSLDPAAREIVVRYVQESTRGMARWTRRGPDFADMTDLDDYMHEVAGRVGYLLTELFGLRDPALRSASPELLPLGRSFGLGLQTVNVIRGLHSDHLRGWLFIPRSLLGTGEATTGATTAGTTGATGSIDVDIFDPAQGPLRQSVLDRLADDATRHLDDAMDYLTRVPRRHADIRLFCALPVFYAERTLALTRSEADAAFFREIKMTRSDVRSIARKTAVGVRSNTALRWIGRRLRG